MPIELPKVKSQIERVNPKRLIIYSKPKTGKTSAFAGLENNLILDLENGTEYVSAMKVNINSLEELAEVGKAVIAAGKPYNVITIDTVTVLEDMIMPRACQLYKNTAMGKTFTGSDVRTLANGAGYLYIRNAFFEVINYVDTLANHIILSGHIKDKAVDDKGEMVMPANIDLTGKIKSLICANADAIGFLYRKGNQCVLSFKSNDEVTCGARPLHLRNAEIVLTELKEDGTMEYHWDKVYIK
jgi:hypothetical protein